MEAISDPPADIRTGQHAANHKENPFLAGVYAPLHDELSISDLTVSGQIPASLSGRYLRIGPNPYKEPAADYHWFTGDGMVHGIRLRNGKAEWYRNRYVRSQALEAAGGPSAAPGPRRQASDSVNTNVVQMHGRPVVMVEAGSNPAILDNDLNTVAYTDFEGSLAAPFSAHPHLDPLTGEFHAITYQGTIPDTIWHVVLDPTGKVTRQLPIPVQHGPSIHDCSITKHYVIILDLPVTLSIAAALAGQKFPYAWNTEHQARIGLLPRQGGVDDIIWCSIDPCYVFHVVNSYEEADGTVIVDCSVHQTMFEGRSVGPHGKPLGFERWRVDPKTKTVERQTIDAAPQDFPRPDERFFGQAYRYAWAVGIADEHEAGFLGPQPLYFYDLVTGKRTSREFGPGAVPGEFVFVPRAADASEGDGWLMGYVIDTLSQSTVLVILDAMDSAAEPVARIHIPHRVPAGFHGNWIPDV